MTETIDDLIQKARENGLRDVADTMEYMMSEGDPFAVDPAEYPATGDRAVAFRSGVVWGVEYVRNQNDEARPKHREAFVSSLIAGGKTRLADAFDYCWANSEDVTSPDFDVTELPIEGEQLSAFSLGMSFGITNARAENS